MIGSVLALVLVARAVGVVGVARQGSPLVRRPGRAPLETVDGFGRERVSLGLGQPAPRSVLVAFVAAAGRSSLLPANAVRSAGLDWTVVGRAGGRGGEVGVWDDVVPTTSMVSSPVDVAVGGAAQLELTVMRFAPGTIVQRAKSSLGVLVQRKTVMVA